MINLDLSDEEVITFNELKAQQLYCKIYIAINGKMAYTQDEVDILKNVLKVQLNLKLVENKIEQFLKKYERILFAYRTDDLVEFFEQPKYRISEARERELSKECLGYATNVSELSDALEEKMKIEGELENGTNHFRRTIQN